ncbi:hypothetical protein U9M48_015575 [Paspalum notatum var. saurae]|uniref:Uncharacterized protein n=1 Tax=Paspalum notatum var. saurae TaxID=547442 RepID=A0AAQ3T3E0_PASNO
MHIDHEIEEPTQDLPLIEKPTTSGTRSKKTTCRRVGRPRNKGLHGARPPTRQTNVHIGL